MATFQRLFKQGDLTMTKSELSAFIFGVIVSYVAMLAMLSIKSEQVELPCFEAQIKGYVLQKCGHKEVKKVQQPQEATNEVVTEIIVEDDNGTINQWKQKFFPQNKPSN